MNLGACCLPVSQVAIKHLAIAVGVSTPPHLHAALMFRSRNGVSVLDFTLGGDVRKSTAGQITSRFAWVTPILHEDPVVNEHWLEQIAGYCSSIGEKPRRFAYSFEFKSKSEISKQRDQFVIKDVRGFTCATFILGIFQHFKLPLLDLATWNVNSADTQWQQQMVELITKHQSQLGLHNHQIATLSNEIPCIRYSPKMVIGACRVGGLAADCAVSNEAGAEAMRWLASSLISHQ